jgi:hypothetical protein
MLYNHSIHVNRIHKQSFWTIQKLNANQKNKKNAFINVIVANYILYIFKVNSKDKNYCILKKNTLMLV